MTFVEAEMVTITVELMKPRLTALRNLFPGQTDAEIIDGLIEELFACFGVIE